MNMGCGWEMVNRKKGEGRTSMLSIEERDQLKMLLEKIQGQQDPAKKINLDVSDRQRDSQGRFLPKESQSEIKEESRSRSDRMIKVVKVKGSYNSYLVKDVWLTDAEKDLLLGAAIVVFLAVMF
ncbi:hypothetical protein [Metabacillus sp. Hm71]|uniref:hypothetical protein n=1 Tax=Metabacillus sp. Hm71 TaxID=3450743 RepID=UPI003F43E275